MTNPLAVQAAGGLVLATLVAWQLALGLRWIRLGPKQFTVHRITGITLAVLVIPHLLQGLWLAFGWFGQVFLPLYGL